MPDYGLTPSGPIPKTTAIVLDELQGELRSKYGVGVPLGSQTLLGTLAAIVADRCGSLWDLWLATIAAGDSDSAEDAALEVISAYQLVLREGPRPSVATLTLTGVAGTVVTSGSTAVIPGAVTAFATVTDVTLTALTAWAATTAYAIGTRVTRGGLAYLCVVAGMSGSTGPASTDYLPEVDGSAQWRYLGEGVAAGDVEARCTEDGPTDALAYVIREIGSSTAGWIGVINTLDATPGQLTQRDSSLRVTRENALAHAGVGTPEAIRADVLAVPGVRSCSVISNRTEVTDPDGIPPKSIEVLVTGGDDDVVAAAIYGSTGATSGLHGSTSVIVVDSEGVDQLIRFSRPTLIPIYVTITVRRDPLRFPADGAALVAGRIVNYGDAQQTGVDVDALALAGQVVPLLVDGVVREQVTGVTGAAAAAVGVAPAPTGLSVAISRRQFADLDSSRVVVTETAP